MKLLITGAHSTPAAALIDSIENKKNIVYVGRKYAVYGEKIVSLDYKEITKRNVRFVHLETGRLTRLLSLNTVINIFKIPLGFIRSFFILKKEKPDVILSFGGYIALPIAIVGNIMGIPVFTHEQTISPGLSNRAISFFANQVFCSFEESLDFFPKNKTILTGNPIRKSVFNTADKPFLIDKTKPVIYVTGGSLGSHSINLLIQKIAHKLLDKYIIIHQTGESKEYKNYESLSGFRESLPSDKKANYYLARHFFDDEIGYIYSLADLVVCRAGANTVFELLALKKPALFIPLPWSAGGEQQKQAEIFKKNKIGEIFSQSKSSEELLDLIDKMIINLDYYKNNFAKTKIVIPKNASEIIIKKISAIC